MNSILLRKSASENLAYGVKLQHIEFLKSKINSPFAMTSFIVLPQFSTNNDKHEEKECWIVIDGEGILFSGNSSYLIKQGDICYFCPYQEHYIKNNSDRPIEIISIFW